MDSPNRVIVDPIEGTMQAEGRKFIGIFGLVVNFQQTSMRGCHLERGATSRLWPLLMAGGAGRALILPDVAHKLRLQALCTQLSAHVQTAFAYRNFVIPGTKIRTTGQIRRRMSTSATSGRLRP